MIIRFALILLIAVSVATTRQVVLLSSPAAGSAGVRSAGWINRIAVGLSHTGIGHDQHQRLTTVGVYASVDGSGICVLADSCESLAAPVGQWHRFSLPPPLF